MRGKNMTAPELGDLFDSPEFKNDLDDLSTYLASIMQERPIIYCLAKQMWKAGIKFELEAKKKDLLVNGRRIEFKFTYDFDAEKLRRSREYGDMPLEEMWDEVRGTSRRRANEKCEKENVHYGEQNPG
jgi:hypothetical protein